MRAACTEEADLRLEGADVERIWRAVAGSHVTSADGARVNLDHATDPVPAATFLPEYAKFAADGAFGIPIARTYPLHEWRAAVELSMSGHPRGKLVLLPEQNAL